MSAEGKPIISFENTQTSFAYKSNEDLKKAKFLFNSMGFEWLVKIGTRLTPWAIKSGLPVKGIIRKTIFKQFVGGETLDDTKIVAENLSKYDVQVILDYGVEGGDDGEDGFENAMNEFIKVIEYASNVPSIPFMSIKITGIARFSLLEKIDEQMHFGTDSLIIRYKKAIETLSEIEKQEWARVEERLEKICSIGLAKQVGVLIDAEETWVQDPVDALCCLMMDKFNTKNPVVYNTIQLYRHDRLGFLRTMLEAATQRGFILAVKLVRGAYMEKERRRAEEKQYPSPIQPSKQATDNDYNEALNLCLDHLNQVSVVVATHNEYSNQLAAELLHKKGLPLHHEHVHFSQLYGMSDNITFNLAAAGISVSKYLPFGPIEDVVPYLMRRAQENTSVGGQTSRELLLIKKEMKRRGL